MVDEERNSHVVLVSFIMETTLSAMGLNFLSSFLDGLGELVVAEAERTDQYPFKEALRQDLKREKDKEKDIDGSGMYR